MTIRKRFFLSHAAMIIMPVIVIILIMLLLQVMLRGEVGWNGNQRTIQNEIITESFRKLMKVASTDQDKFLDSSYLHDISQQIEKENSYLIVRKNGKIYFKSDKLKSISTQNLPVFGS